MSVLDDDQLALQQGARGLLSSRHPIAVVRAGAGTELGCSPELWREIGAAGWPGIIHGEATGGAGGGLLDLVAVTFELGRHLVTSPLVPSAVVGATVLAHVAGDDHRLGALVTGASVMAPALRRATGQLDTERSDVIATATATGWRLDGETTLVAHVAASDALLVLARLGAAGGPGLFVVTPTTAGVTTTRLANLGDQPLSHVAFEAVEVGAPDGFVDVERNRAALAAALALQTVLVGAAVVGIGERLLELTVDYALDRSQFGRPIGSFQAVQYLCSDIAISTHLLKSLVLKAGRDADGVGDGWPVSAALVGAHGATVARTIAHSAHEVFAGLGFMEEHDLHLYSRRLKHLEIEFGERRRHDDAIVRHLVTSGAGATAGPTA